MAMMRRLAASVLIVVMAACSPVLATPTPYRPPPPLQRVVAVATGTTQGLADAPRFRDSAAYVAYMQARWTTLAMLVARCQALVDAVDRQPTIATDPHLASEMLALAVRFRTWGEEVAAAPSAPPGAAEIDPDVRKLARDAVSVADLIDAGFADQSPSPGYVATVGMFVGNLSTEATDTGLRARNIAR